MNILLMQPEGPMVRYTHDRMLMVDDLNPEIKTKWRMSRGEMFRFGWNCIMAAIFTPDK